MSERFLKYETEVENGMVDERGVLLPGGSAGGAGGYTYFCISKNSLNNNNEFFIYKMDKLGVLNGGHPYESDVTKTEFEKTLMTSPIMFIQIKDHEPCMDFTGGFEPIATPRYYIYMGKSLFEHNNNYDGTLLFAVE